MPAPKHVERMAQTQLIAPQHLLDQYAALAYVSKASRAQTLRDGLKSALPKFMKASAQELAELDEIAQRLGFRTGVELAVQAIEDGHSIDHVRTLQVYPHKA